MYKLKCGIYVLPLCNCVAFTTAYIKRNSGFVAAGTLLWGDA